MAFGEGVEMGHTAGTGVFPSIGRLLRTAGIAAAAALVVAFAGFNVVHRLTPSETRVYREGEQERIESRVAVGRALPRDHCLLTWSGVGPPGTTYAIEVSGADFRLVARESGLPRPAYRVPSSALAGLPKNAEIYWRIEASLPGGGRLASATFMTPID